MSSFEAHITYLDCNEEKLTFVGEKFGFHFSKIDGDEIMGAGPKSYLTSSSDNYNELYQRMVALTDQTPWLRRKIEAILIDERFSIE